MPTIQQATKDLQTANGYVDLLEHNLGKKTSDRMRRMLVAAFMAGTKHGRETAKPQSQEQELLDLLGKRRGGIFS